MGSEGFQLAFFTAAFLVIGLLLLMYPARTLRWLIRDRQWLADEPWMLTTCRGIGIAFVAMGARILMS